MRYRLAFVMSLLLAGLAAECQAQSWGSRCGPVGPMVAPAASPTPRYQWRSHGGCHYLYWGDRQVAGYDPAENVYRVYDADRGQWGPPQAPPWQAPAPLPPSPKAPPSAKQGKPQARRAAPAILACALCQEPSCDCSRGGPCQEGPGCQKKKALPGQRIEYTEQGEEIENYGLDRKELSGRSKYYLRGEPVGRKEFMEALSAASLTDDSRAVRITVIGPKELRQPVLEMLDKMPECQGALIKAYDPTHWAVRSCGFVTTGRPTTYVQRPDGGVVSRFDAPPSQPLLAQAVLQAKRQADPNYDPKKDPQGPASAVPWQDLLQSPWGPVVGLGAGGLLLLLLRKKG